MYFSISLRLAGESISGIKALDTSRRLGLKDSNDLYFEPSPSTSGYHAGTARVDESFVRAWFKPEQTEAEAVVPLRFLMAGDVRYCNDCNSHSVTFAEGMSVERAKELYIAVRFAACREQVTKLTDQRDSLREQLEECRRQLAPVS